VQNLTSYSATQISQKGDEISRLSRLVFEIWRGTDRRQTNDRRDDCYRRLLHLQCVSLISTYGTIN